jgi:pimeloyl-ACP methyl ester carboxylesterase
MKRRAGHRPSAPLPWPLEISAALPKARLRDLPNAELHLIDAGHFAVEEKAAEIAQYVLDFMAKLPR